MYELVGHPGEGKITAINPSPPSMDIACHWGLENPAPNDLRCLPLLVPPLQKRQALALRFDIILRQVVRGVLARDAAEELGCELGDVVEVPDGYLAYLRVLLVERDIRPLGHRSFLTLMTSA